MCFRRTGRSDVTGFRRSSAFGRQMLPTEGRARTSMAAGGTARSDVRCSRRRGALGRQWLPVARRARASGASGGAVRSEVRCFRRSGALGRRWLPMERHVRTSLTSSRPAHREHIRVGVLPPLPGPRLPSRRFAVPLTHCFGDAASCGWPQPSLALPAARASCPLCLSKPGRRCFFTYAARRAGLKTASATGGIHARLGSCGVDRARVGCRWLGDSAGERLRPFSWALRVQRTHPTSG